MRGVPSEAAGEAMSRIELGVKRYGTYRWLVCRSLSEARAIASDLVESNVAYPARLRINGVVRLECESTPNLEFRWRRPEAIAAGERDLALAS